MKQVSNNVISEGGAMDTFKDRVLIPIGIDEGNSRTAYDLGGQEISNQNIYNTTTESGKDTISHKIANAIGINKLCKGYIDAEDKEQYWNSLSRTEKAGCLGAFGIRRIGDLGRVAGKFGTFGVKSALGTAANVGLAAKYVGSLGYSPNSSRFAYVDHTEFAPREVDRSLDGGKRKSKKSRKSTKKTKKTKKTKTRRSKK